jgi:hypothetical protein
MEPIEEIKADRRELIRHVERLSGALKKCLLVLMGYELNKKSLEDALSASQEALRFLKEHGK